MKSTGLIYKITNNINGKCYVGQTTRSLDVRISEHIFASTKKDTQSVLCKAIRKYGWSNFSYEILENDIPIEQLNNKEVIYGKIHKALVPNGYSLEIMGGPGSMMSEETKRKIGKANKLALTGRKLTPEQLENFITKFRLTVRKHKEMGKIHKNKGNPPWNKGISPTVETRRKQSLVKLGKKDSQETREKKKISALKRKPFTQEHRNNLSRACKKIVHTKEWSDKVQESIRKKKLKPGYVNPQIGKVVSDETKKRMSDSRKEYFKRIKLLKELQQLNYEINEKNN